MDEFWKALISGLSPERASHCHYLWLLPFGIICAVFLIGVIV
jgi:hypothetical protein